MSDTARVKARLSLLSQSLGELEDELDSIFSTHLGSVTKGLDSIQQAKLATLLPYITYDLIFSTFG